MTNGPNFEQLNKKTLAVSLLCVVLVLLSYAFVDRPVAHYVHDRRFADFPVLEWMTRLPDILQAWVPVVLVALMLRLAQGPLLRWQRVVVVACLGIILAEQFKDVLAYVFGRYWPQTWIDNNPSLIRDGAYGFHPFHSGKGYRSFPSGHTARTLAVASIIWMTYPKWRWMCVLAATAVGAGLVLMDYHFIGDVVAGGFVGGIIGVYMVTYSGLSGPDPPLSQGKVSFRDMQQDPYDA